MKNRIRLNDESGIAMIKIIIIAIVISILGIMIFLTINQKQSTNKVDNIVNYTEEQDSIDDSLIDEEINTETNSGSEEVNSPRITDGQLEVFKKRIGSICYEYQNAEEEEGFNSSVIILYPDNTCLLGFYQFPYNFEGTYSKKDKKIICKINSLSTEYANQDVDDFEIVLKIIDDSNIKIESVSVSSITVKEFAYENIMDETRVFDLSLIKNEGVTYTNYIGLFEKTYEKYLKLVNYESSDLGPMRGILVELGLSTEEELEKNVETSGLDFSDMSSYIKSDVKYDLFKETMLQYVTEELFNKEYFQYKNIDGYVGFCNTACGFESLEYCSAILPSEISKNEYIFHVLIKDVIEYNHYIEGDPYIKENDCYFIKFVNTKYENGKIKIDVDSN